LLAAMRSEPVRAGVDEGGRVGYTPAKQESPRRALSLLTNLARGHALAHGRRQLTPEDLPPLARVTVSSMPTHCAKAFTALVDAGGEPLSVAEVQVALAVASPHTARNVMRDLDDRGIMRFAEEGQGRPARLTFTPEWEWCATPEFRAMLLGQPGKN